MMDTFKIIGIRVLEKCAPHIKKVLKENSNYFFQNEYVYDNKIQWVKKREDYKLINENFFSIETDIFNDIKLNIYNPQNEMFRLLGTKRSFSQNETFFFSHPYPPYPALFRLISHF